MDQKNKKKESETSDVDSTSSTANNNYVVSGVSQMEKDLEERIRKLAQTVEDLKKKKGL